MNDKWNREIGNQRSGETCEADRIGQVISRGTEAGENGGAFSTGPGSKMGVAWLLRQGSETEWGNTKVIYMGATPNADALEVLYDGRDDLEEGTEVDGLANYV